MLELFQTTIKGWYPLKTTTKNPDAESPAKNFYTVQDRHTMSMKHEYKVGVALSESANINHLQRPLVEKMTSFPANKENLIIYETAHSYT